MTIIVNGVSFEHGWSALFGDHGREPVTVTYDEIVELAGMPGTPTVTYAAKRNNGDTMRSGTMYPGCKPLELSHTMRFTVVHTGGA